MLRIFCTEYQRIRTTPAEIYYAPSCKITQTNFATNSEINNLTKLHSNHSL